ncbi:2-hydroxyacid dehydrogenase [Devosia limi DSM 17137]|uniref:2-hydroxyacid dehydrogenase n=1 Tax=Devosia limi DSM 17137 TaxID=1121477 RepID=A0A0F5LSF1_9HYPH|nr:hydroxyacid dehydrogenase [Devosia limi]KKB85074.1 2-hydroxyacid dehydrogenase [Devosia limi DSM 17137]SHF39418.1 D-3-phosphoglycerate dehydrogenase [Devosia limi DSM 17137]
MADLSAATGQRGRRILVTHNTIAASAVALLNANDIDVYFSPPYTPSDAVAARCAELGVDAIMVRQGQINAEVINASPKLKVIVKHGVGVDNVDIAAAAARGVPVLRSMGSNALAVAEHSIALAIALLKQLPTLDKAIKGGAWPKPSFIGRDIAGSVIGLVGFGSIGKETGRLAAALGMTVLVFDPMTPQAASDCGFEPVTLDDLVSRADIVSLHCPLTNETRNLINAARIEQMKSDAIIVNTARGGIIDEAALLDALARKRIAGAGLDSFSVEPPPVDSPLWAMDNLLVTSHVAGVTKGSAIQMAETAARHIISVLDGAPADERSLARVSELSAS